MMPARLEVAFRELYEINVHILKLCWQRWSLQYSEGGGLRPFALEP